MSDRARNQLSQVRRRRGVSASELAKQVGVSRQTIYAIEAGTYVPNTEIALRLARELEVTVEDLFSLPADESPAPEAPTSELLSAAAPVNGQPVRVCRVGERWVSIPVSAAPYYLPEADGVISRLGRQRNRADLIIFSQDDAAQKRLVLAGCDPATSLLAHMVEKTAASRLSRPRLRASSP